ncbi:uncharacterized protein PG998_013546 [Apiospora kogelbergensis]|uniref:uncharacterized protein n=1 Tax=Apiospora kogelbergensis TaxID=1337665 RepID=UPI00312E6F54
MSAHVVYTGAVPGQEGTLFQGSKFWIAQRTPLRKTWLDYIKGNGGQVVPLEKDADYLIADHVRKDAPPGSYSWKWIEDSVKKGELLDAEEYLIGAKAGQQAPTKGTKATKSTRTPFTGEDDRLLTEHVLKREREGELIAGNKIYQEFAEKSWRDRWVKKLSLKPRTNISHDDSDPQPAQEHEPRAGRQAPASPSRSQPPPSPALANANREKKTRLKFTAEEDRQLTEYVLERTAKTGFDRGRVVFVEHAKEFPQHTWQAYKDRWIKYLEPASRKNNEEVAEEEEEEEEVLPRTRSSTSKTNATRSSKDKRPDEAPRTANETPKSVRRKPDIAGGKPDSPKGDLRNAKQQRGLPAPVSSSHMSEPPQVGESAETQEEVDYQLDDENAQEGLQIARMSADDRNNQLLSFEADDYAGPHPQSREQFYNDYQSFTEASGIRPNFWPTVRGQSFDLWNLWQHAVSQNVDPAERDWQQIAEKLEYDWIGHEGVENDLRAIYEDHLAIFEESLVNFELYESDDSEGDEDVSEEAADANSISEAVDRNSEAQFNSSPPKQPSLKRTLDETQLSDQLYRESSGKRQRIHRDTEIPSTPDTKNGTKHLRRPVSAAVSPSDRRLSTLPKSSRVQRSTQKGQEYSSHHDPMITNSTKLYSKRLMVEPETQDFHYEPETQNLDFDTEMDDIQEESQPNMTPSQQLRIESSPVKSAPRVFTKPNTPTPKRKANISPFLDYPDEEPEQPAPKARFGKGKNPPFVRLREAAAAVTKTLSWLASRPVFHCAPAKATAPCLAPCHFASLDSFISFVISRALEASTTAAFPRSSKLSAPAATPNPPPSSARDPVASGTASLNRYIDHWVALGYPPPVARHALEVTSWQKDLVVEIIEPLKEGKPLPTNIEGVWTAKDDMKLQFLLQQDATGGKQDVADEKRARKTEKKRADFEKHLMNKHGKGHIKLRKEWYERKKFLGWGETE